MWKVAQFVPVHKKSSMSQAKNYRPISLLLIVSKVMKSKVNKAIMNFLEAGHVLSAHQFGFRRRLGTDDLPTTLQHHWAVTAGNGDSVHVLAIDIAGAFDKVSHWGALHKASATGIAGPLHRWLTSYLSDRRLRVVIGGQQSFLFPFETDMPRGSILGPALFLLYVNDCEDHVGNRAQLDTKADDTTLHKCLSPANVVYQCQELQEAVNAASAWGKSWHITFEPTKSQALTIGKNLSTVPITAQGLFIPRKVGKSWGLIAQSQRLRKRSLSLRRQSAS